ncbi:DNA primase [Candidatus Rhodobacter oscarellae]|uniref:DNA primase n=2 Tax=Candidatus Rhodobacter oscarellae TaxID=1675527 RepID=A0A0J9E6F2_9RHOB|nr:DNA primase [Candidatus Rhodobacter lobularis]
MSQVAGRKVMWDARKSNQGKGDMWAPCPFHQEKTASFHVDDRKGYYYCFGCHAKGDAISFVRETENVSFMEAVEILAREVGMQVPERDPKAQEKADRITRLAEVMEQAVQHFRLQLKTAGAAEARDYLARRGLSEAAQERWEIGFAPDAWQGLWDHLKAKSVEDDLILGAGLAKPSQKGGRPYDTFRGRIIFPIRDARGRCIAFGGRAMDPGDNAKYLNSPETELFDKGRSLFNVRAAREAAGKGQPLVVAEGYMDVIALSEAGYTGAVAPLGTAVTETQLQMLWRIAPEPLVALDGDTAGLRAAMRLIDLALPLLEAGRSLRFSIMPPGQDPDDVIRSGGSGAMQKLLDQAQPMVSLLWRRETEGKNFDSPERKAALDKALREAISKIQDPSLRGHYGEEIKRLRWDLFGTARQAQKPRGSGQGRGAWQRRGEPQGPTPGAKQSALAAQSGEVEQRLRESVILTGLLVQPQLLDRFEPELDDLSCTTPDHEALRRAILRHATAEDPPSAVAGELGTDPLETLMAQGHIRVIPALRADADPDETQACIAEEFAKIAASLGAEHEVREAILDIESLADEGLTWRLTQAAEARRAAQKGHEEEEIDFETAPNGAKINRSERKALDALVDGIAFSKPHRTPR